jgi:hypothetical protein
MGKNYFSLKRVKQLELALPKVVARTSESHFKANFEKQGFDDAGVDPWKEVKRRTPGTKAYKYAKASARTRAILVGRGSGRMKRDIKARKVTTSEVTISMSINYARYHNEGTERLPQRKMIGNSRSLSEKIKKEMNGLITTIFSSK